MTELVFLFTDELLFVVFVFEFVTFELEFVCDLVFVIWDFTLVFTWDLVFVFWFLIVVFVVPALFVLAVLVLLDLEFVLVGAVAVFVAAAGV